MYQDDGDLRLTILSLMIMGAGLILEIVRRMPDFIQEYTKGAVVTVIFVAFLILILELVGFHILQEHWDTISYLEK